MLRRASEHLNVVPLCHKLIYVTWVQDGRDIPAPLPEEKEEAQD